MKKQIADLKVGDQIKGLEDGPSTQFGKITGFGQGCNPVTKRRTRVVYFTAKGPKGTYATCGAFYPSEFVQVKAVV